MQRRLRRFERQPERLGGRQGSRDKILSALAIIERYRFIPSSSLVKLMPGHARTNYDNLQILYHRGLVNRFALPKYGGPGEHIHYLDSLDALDTLIAEGPLAGLATPDLRRKQELIRYNRESDYSRLHRDPDSQGRVLYMHHELMISRFHALLELACKKSGGAAILERWKQGSELYSRIELPAVKPNRLDPSTGRTIWEEFDQEQWLPHRPDAFFTLYFPGKPAGKQRSHFFYEADRGTENTTRFKMKLRAHFHFVYKHKRQQRAPYSVPGIRAVLTESTNSRWANNLRNAAKENVVSPKPYPLFWFTTSEIFNDPTGNNPRLYLERPETIFRRIWYTPVNDQPFSLVD